MTSLILKIYDWLNCRRALAVALLLGIVGLLVLSMMRMHYSENITDFLPQSKHNAKYMEVANRLGGADRIAVLFDATAGDEHDSSIMEAMSTFERIWTERDSLSQYPLCAQVDETAVMDMLGFVSENIPYYLTEEDYQHIDSLLSEKGYIASQLELDKQLLMLPTASAFGVDRDPLHLFGGVQKRFGRLGKSTQYEVLDGYLFEKHTHKGFIMFTSPYGSSESKHNGELSERLDSVMQETMQSVKGVSVSAVGGPLIAVTNARQIKSDSVLALTLSVVLILLLLLYVFRRLSDLLWIGFSLAFGAVFALGIIALYKESISIIVLGIGSVIIGIAANYPLHFLDHLRHEGDMRNAVKMMVPPLFIGNITTVGAFLCLVPLRAEALRDLGVFGALMLLGTIIFVLVFLPVFTHPNIGRKTGYIDLRLPRVKVGRSMLIVPFVLITLVFGYFSWFTSFDGDMHNINYMTEQQRTDMQTLSRSLGEGDSMVTAFGVSTGQSLDEALSLSQNQSDMVKKKFAQAGVSALSDFVPSRETQEVRLKSWQEFCRKYAQRIKTELQSEALRQGFSEDAFDGFTAMLDGTYPIRKAEYFTPVLDVLGVGFTYLSGKQVSVVNRYTVDRGDMDALVQNCTQSDRSFVFSERGVTSSIVNAISDDFNYLGYVCSLIVFFCLWWSFARLELSLITFLPLAVGWLWILGCMYLCDIRFNIVNIILATFIFGQGDDYTIFITEGLMQEYAYGRKMLAQYRRSIVLSAVIMFLGIGILIVAKHPAMHSLAEVTLVGMATVVLMAILLPPLVFRWIAYKSDAQKRDVPRTIRGCLYTYYTASMFALGIIFYTLWAMVYFALSPRSKEQKSHWLHYKMQLFARRMLWLIPSIRFTINTSGETFERPAVIVANHQSLYDILAIMSLTDRVVFVTKDWVWRNPLLKRALRMSGCIPSIEGIESDKELYADILRRGMSIVVFAEGRRWEDGKVHRFHKGAFLLAQELDLEILPIYLHGFGRMLPRSDFMMRPDEKPYIEVGKRYKPDPALPLQKQASEARAMFASEIARIKAEVEDVEYYTAYVRAKYMYKGKDVETGSRRRLKQLSKHGQSIKGAQFERGTGVLIKNAGQGEIAWMFALLHEDVRFTATDMDGDNVLLGKNCSALPDNLRFEQCVDEKSFEYIIDAKQYE